jgi:hypothetical protein
MPRVQYRAANIGGYTFSRTEIENLSDDEAARLLAEDQRRAGIDFDTP